MSNAVDKVGNAVQSQLNTVGEMLISLSNSYAGFYSFINAFCYVAALVLFMSSLRKLSVISASQGRGNETYGSVLAAMFFGILLAWLPEVIQTASCTAAIAQEQAAAILDYKQTTASSNRYINAVFDLLRLIGVIAFIKSLFMMRQISSGLAPQGISWGSAFWMMVGGAACYNIVPVITVMSATFGLAGVMAKLGLSETVNFYGC